MDKKIGTKVVDEAVVVVAVYPLPNQVV